YILVAHKFFSALGPGMMGLFVSAMFASTMSMISADLSSLASVFTKDIYHRTMNKDAPEKTLLLIGITSTVVFGVLTILSAIITIHLHGAFNTMVEWYAAILGPVSIPLLFGMVYRKATWRGALASWASGFAAFVIVKFVVPLFVGVATPFALYTGIELLVSFSVFYLEGAVSKQTVQEKENVDKLFIQLSNTTS
ncbi:MAG: hypothetical protein WBD36_03360, partial [Bacteroidota bacterium]